MADKDGNVWENAVDETRELVDMMETARSYQNDVQVMNTAKSLVLDTLKLGQN
jgi:flagellar basal-body rod protein FlgC